MAAVPAFSRRGEPLNICLEETNSPGGVCKLRHMTDISTTPDNVCYTVAFDRDDELVHGGVRYNSLGLTIEKDVWCIRRVGDNIAMLVKDGAKRKGHRCLDRCQGWHVITYRWEATGDDGRYQELFKICVDAKWDSKFTITSESLYVVGEKNNVHMYDYNSGRKLCEFRHRDMKEPQNITSAGDGRLFIIDGDTRSIFLFHNIDPIGTLRKFSTITIGQSTSITIFKNHALLLSRGARTIRLLDINTGKEVTEVKLPECIGRYGVQEICVSEAGRLAVANGDVVQICQLEGMEALHQLLNPDSVRSETSPNPFQMFEPAQVTSRRSHSRCLQSSAHSFGSRSADPSLPSTSHLPPGLSGSNVSGVSTLKFTHLTRISTVDDNKCHTLAFDRDGELVHGGFHYDSLKMTSEKIVGCIRKVGDDMIMLANTGFDIEGWTAGQRCFASCTGWHIFAYRRLFTEQIGKYQRVHKLCTKFKGGCKFDIVSGSMYIVGNSKRIEMYDYSSGEIVCGFDHPDMKEPRNIISSEDGRLFVVDIRSIFWFHNKDPVGTVREFGKDFRKAHSITIYKNHLLVFSNQTGLIHILNIDTEEKVTELKLPECIGRGIYDICVDETGRLAVSYGDVIQLWKLEGVEELCPSINSDRPEVSANPFDWPVSNLSPRLYSPPPASPSPKFFRSCSPPSRPIDLSQPSTSQFLELFSMNKVKGVEELSPWLNSDTPEVFTNPFDGPVSSHSRNLHTPTPASPSSRFFRSCSPQSRPSDLSQPSTSRQVLEISSGNKVKEDYITKLSHITNVSSGSNCQTVEFDRDGELIHGGVNYDSLGLTSNKPVACIRRCGDDIVILVKTGHTDYNQRCVDRCVGWHVIEYRCNFTCNRGYQQVSQICVGACAEGSSKFTITSGRLYVNGSSKYLQSYDYASGIRLGDFRYSAMTRFVADTICSSEDGRVFITATGYPIFSFHINDPTRTAKEFYNLAIGRIAIYRNQILMQDMNSIFLLNMETGEKVTELAIPECERSRLSSSIVDFSVSESGRLAFARQLDGVLLYQLEVVEEVSGLLINPDISEAPNNTLSCPSSQAVSSSRSTRSPRNPPVDLSQPSTSSSSAQPFCLTIKNEGNFNFKISHITNISINSGTEEFPQHMHCCAVAFAPDGELIHGGHFGDNLGLASNKQVYCIRRWGDCIVILSKDRSRGSSHCVTRCVGCHLSTYKQGSTQPKGYRCISNRCVQARGFSKFTITQGRLYGVGSKAIVLVYDCGSGEKLCQFRHRNIKSTQDICSTEDGRVFITDQRADLIFSFHTNDPARTFRKFSTGTNLFRRSIITVYNNSLLALCRWLSNLTLTIINAETGEKVTELNLPEVHEGFHPADITVNESGRLALVGTRPFVPIYQLEVCTN